jgi:hypothetical protein
MGPRYVKCMRIIKEIQKTYNRWLWTLMTWLGY